MYNNLLERRGRQGFLENTVFTGLIEYMGCVVGVRVLATARELCIDLGPLAEQLRLGQSVAIDGVCETVTAVDGFQARFDVSPQTLSGTTLSEFAPGRWVNLERPITLQSRLGGHLLAGHIDGMASLHRWSMDGESKVAHFQVDARLTNLMIEKGSVAINGVSLTIADLQDGSFSIAFIPATLESTNLGQLRPGQKVNIETDLIGKYVAKLLAADRKKPITMNTLWEQGFA